MTPVLTTVLLRTQSDERLVGLARGGHERAFEAISDRYRAQLARSLRRYLPAPRIDDVLQQTFISAWKAIGRGVEIRDLQAWLHRIARNAALAELKRPGFDHAELQDSLTLAAGPEDEIERREIMRRTLQGVAALPERQRMALLAVAVEGRPSQDVAHELGISDTATRQLVARARASLRAAATAMTPSPLIAWALQAGHVAAAGEGVAGTAIGAGGAITILKASAAVTAGVIAATAPTAIHDRVSGGSAHAAHVAVAAVSPAAGRAAAVAEHRVASGAGVARATSRTQTLVRSSGSGRVVRGGLVVTGKTTGSAAGPVAGVTAAPTPAPAPVAAAAPAPAAQPAASTSTRRRWSWHWPIGVSSTRPVRSPTRTSSRDPEQQSHPSSHTHTHTTTGTTQVPASTSTTPADTTPTQTTTPTDTTTSTTATTPATSTSADSPPPAPQTTSTSTSDAAPPEASAP